MSKQKSNMFDTLPVHAGSWESSKVTSALFKLVNNDEERQIKATSEEKNKTQSQEITILDTKGNILKKTNAKKRNSHLCECGSSASFCPFLTTHIFPSPIPCIFPSLAYRLFFLPFTSSLE